MLYEIQGSDKSLKPYLFSAHSDVVPTEDQIEKWTEDPFSAHLRKDFIYARGTLDCKASMIAQLEAMRHFLNTHGQPKRTIYLAYGHDEEIEGFKGAKYIAEYIRNKNVSLEYVIDEGTMIITDSFPNFDRPVALISIASKGYLTLKFTVNSSGGHSSMPNQQNSAIFILSEAINKFEKNFLMIIFVLNLSKKNLNLIQTKKKQIAKFSGVWARETYI